MTQEEQDFLYFRENQMLSFDPVTGSISTYKTDKLGRTRHFHNIGSKNQDGYERVWCNGTLRMKHRLVFWLINSTMPGEIDHINGNRSDNRPINLRSVNRSQNKRNQSEKRTYKWLTSDQVHLLCSDIQSGKYSISTLALKYGRSRAQVKQIMGKKCWSTISDQYF